MGVRPCCRFQLVTCWSSVLDVICVYNDKSIPRHSMYAISAYIGVVLGVNVGIYGIHGVSGIYKSQTHMGLAYTWIFQLCNIYAFSSIKPA